METTCKRCAGLTVAHWVLDEAGQAWVEMARCVNCGSLHDAVIATNQGVLAGVGEGQRARKGKYSDGGMERRGTR